MKHNIQPILFLCFAAIAGLIAYNIYNISTRLPEKAYSTFLEELDQEKISKVTIKGGMISGFDTFDREFETFSPDVPTLIPLLRQKNIEITTKQPPAAPGILRDMLIILLLLGGVADLQQERGSGTSKICQQEQF